MKGQWKRQWKRKLSVLLTAAMVLSTVNIGPLYAAEAESVLPWVDVIIGEKSTHMGTATMSDTEEVATSSNGDETATSSDAENDIDRDTDLIYDLDTNLEELEEIPDEVMLTAMAGDYLVTVQADAGVLPDDVSLSAELMEDDSITDTLKELVENLDGDVEIADEELVCFDVAILDQDGKEVQPDKKKGSARISFENLVEPVAETEELGAQSGQIYHLDETSRKVEKIDTEVTEQVLQAEIKQFSPMIVRIGSTVSESGSVTTGVVDGVLTVTKLKGNGTGWSWNGGRLDLNDKFVGNKQIVFDSAITVTPQIKLNRGLTITPDAGTPAIITSGDITITSTVNAKLTVGGLIQANNVTIDSNAIVEAAGDELFRIAEGMALNVDGGQILIEDFEDSAIHCAGTLDITAGGNITVSSKGTGSDNPAGIKAADTGIMKLDGGTLTAENDGSIYLSAGAKVEGMSGKLNDQGKVLLENGEVTVAAADTPAADNQLTEGLYVGAGNVFSKESSSVSIVTGLVDGILTITREKGSGTGWSWNGGRLDLNDKFVGNKQIVFVPEVTVVPQIKLNRGLTITPDTGTSAIIASGDLVITSTTSAKLTAGGPIEAKNVTVSGNAIVVATGSKLFHIDEGITLTVDGGQILIENFDDSAITCAGTVNIVGGGDITVNTKGTGNGNPAGIQVTDPGKMNLDGGTLTGGNGGSIYLGAGAKVEGMADILSDQGKKFTESGEVTVVAANTAAADDQLTEGLYVGDGNTFSKGGSGGETVSTGLVDGILTIAREKGNGTGWSWNGGRLDLNDKFAGNRQIVFAPGVTPQIKLNRGVTITPDDGKAAITASGDLTITSTTNSRLTAGGSIEAKSVTVNGSASVTAKADGTNAALSATSGTIMIGDTATVTADGAIEAGGNVTISGSASVVVKADRASAALYAKNGTLTISDTATVIAGNQSGAAMYPAPDTGSYRNLRIAASEYASGKPETKYSADRISSYQYLKIEKLLALDEIEGSVENLAEDASPALIDALADQIRSLSPEDKKSIKTETIVKLDQLLQNASGISPISNIEAPAGLGANQQLQKVEIRGALLAAGITSESGSTRVELNVVQKQPENGAAVTFSCDLMVNGSKVELMVPVTVTVKLPPEFYPVRGYKIHHVGTGIDEWMDFVYNGADNSTEFQTDHFSTFSIVKQSSSSGGSGGGGGSSSGGGGGGGSSSGGGGVSRSLAGATVPGKETGRWIQDAAGWWYENVDKGYPKDGWSQIRHGGKDEWYFFDKNGYMATGWTLWNGNWYYLSSASDGTSGIMLTGWQTIDGKRYYFSEVPGGTLGAKLTNIWIGEYYLNQDGVWEAGRTKR